MRIEIKLTKNKENYKSFSIPKATYSRKKIIEQLDLYEKEMNA